MARLNKEDRPWWCPVVYFVEDHWRGMGLLLATVVVGTIAAILIHRMNETDVRLEKGICTIVAVYESGPSEAPVTNTKLLAAAARLRENANCPPPPIR